ncbi:MAG: PAS domain S-box protein [Ardenticatenaceae bacterium]|nr:PAS domain S-box protein [Ardenticatenaceae bacterium]
MLTQLRWRIAIPYAILIGLGTAVMAYSAGRPVCSTDPECLRRTFWLGMALLLVTAVALALLLAARFTRPLADLTTTTQRLLEGDRRARIMQYGRGETAEFIRVYNQLIDQGSQLINELTEERDQLASVLAYMADGVIIADAYGYVRQVNPAAMRLLGTTEKKALGRPIAETLRHHQLIGLWQQCQSETEEQIAAVEVGPDLFLQAVVTPIMRRGSLVYLVILQDLTTIRRLETIRRDFISNISHELRTPLASLRAVVETLQDGALADPPAATRFLSRAEHEVDTLTQMVEELLELSRIESGRVPLKLSPTAVYDLVQRPLERFRAQANRDNLQLVVDIPGDLPLVLADAGRMQQVVNNLVHNALKFTPRGQVTVAAYVDQEAPKQVREKLAGAPPSVVISVTDTGVGIPEEDLPRIFERFYKSDRARTRGRGGTGLGLAIARHIVQAHNGRIWAESKEGKGSTFYFSLRSS